jgi:hypothetical protein
MRFIINITHAYSGNPLATTELPRFESDTPLDATRILAENHQH